MIILLIIMLKIIFENFNIIEFFKSFSIALRILLKIK